MIVLKLDEIASQNAFIAFNQEVRKIISGQTRYDLDTYKGKIIQVVLLFCCCFAVSFRFLLLSTPTFPPPYPIISFACLLLYNIQ